MLCLEEVRRRLEPMNISRVARETGVHPNAIYRLVNGKSTPSYSTVEKLSHWLETMESSNADR